MSQETFARSWKERRVHLRIVPGRSHIEGGMVSTIQQPPRKGMRIAHGPEERQPKLLDQVRQAIRVRHYSLRTEEAYVHWVRGFILFHNKRHPREMGETEMTQFLSTLAVERQV